MHVQEENRKELNFEGFTAYLRTPAGGNRNKATAESITSDLSCFIQSISDTCNKIKSI